MFTQHLDLTGLLDEIRQEATAPDVEQGPLDL
jgi:hypothetical protein